MNIRSAVRSPERSAYSPPGVAVRQREIAAGLYFLSIPREPANGSVWLFEDITETRRESLEHAVAEGTADRASANYI